MDYTCHSLDGYKNRNADEQVHSTENAEHKSKAEKPSRTATELEKVARVSIFKTPMVIDPTATKTRLLKHNVLEKWSEENQPLNLSTNRSADAENIQDNRVPSSCDPKPIVESSSQKSELPYVEPSWSGKPDVSYCFEIIKNGIILSTVDLSEKSYTVFGRLGTSDFVLEHPSVSRYHAVVQYRIVEDENDSKGFYIYDLESTHGTFVNKERIEPRKYCKLHVGHVVKFGGSSRMFILQGPSEDEERESEFTVTELKEMRRQHEEKLKLLQEKEKEKEAEKSSEDKGINWGMGEDAEEDPNTENPFALSTPNEDLYLDDPKKTLRGWFEREGYDLEYDVEEKGFGHFSCKIHLPIDTSTSEYVYAEASVKGKKKEAVAACALEACRILDRYGLLRQAHHESRKRKQKNWEEDDFYDSDEDTYLDRTGTIEKKRDLRKRMFSKEQSIETYESLVKKLQDVEKEIEAITTKLQRTKSLAKKAEGGDGNEEDELDAYMSSLQSGVVDKKMQSKLQFQLNQMHQEQRRLMKLVEIARPVNLPALEKHSSCIGEKITSIKKTHLSHSGIMKGRLLKKVKKAPIPQPQAQVKDTTHGDDDVVEEEEDENDDEMDSFDHSSATTLEVEMKDSGDQKDDIPKEIEKDKTEILENHEKQEAVQSDTASSTKDASVKGPHLPSKKDLLHIEVSKQGEKKHKTDQKDKKKSSAYDATDPEYAMWLPPTDQSGDGRTHLNAKYGY